MADNLNDNQKPYQPPQPFEYEQPDLPSSTSQAAEDAFDKRKQTNQQDTSDEQNEENQNKSEPESLSPDQQLDVAKRFTQNRQAEKVNTTTDTDKTAQMAADMAVKIPSFGWFVKIAAFLIKGLKSIFGPGIASFLSFFIIFFSALMPLNFIIFIGFIIQLVLSVCLAFIFTIFFQKKIMAFVDQAGKITPSLPTKK